MLVAGAVTVAFGIGLFFYSRSDLWLDEALTVNIARLPLGDLRGALEHDGAPPLYYVLLHVWTGVFGDSDVAARSLSGVFALGAVVTCWFAARRWFDERTAWLTVIVLATNPFLIRYATEARMYTLEILLVACGIIAVPRALEQPTLGRLACVSLVTARARLHAVLGVLPRRCRRRRRCCSSRGVHAARRREYLHGRRRDRRRVAAVRSRGCRRSCPSARTPVRRGASPVLPGLPLGMTFLGFAGGDEQEGWVLVFLLVALLLLGLFARALDDRHLEVDLRAQPARAVARHHRRRHARRSA